MKTTLVALALVLAGCGWQLRGDLLPPLDIDSLRVVAAEEHTELLRELNLALQRQDINVVDATDKAQYTLALGEEQTRKRTVGVGADNLAAAYELTLSQDYQLLDNQGRALADNTTARVIRSFDASDPTGLNREEELLLKQMRRDLVQQILRRTYFLLRDQSEPASP